MIYNNLMRVPELVNSKYDVFQYIKLAGKLLAEWVNMCN